MMATASLPHLQHNSSSLSIQQLFHGDQQCDRPGCLFQKRSPVQEEGKSFGGPFRLVFLFLSRQRTHPGQHHKRSDRHHKWLNSQWLHLEGKGGEGQGRGCLTGLGCQKRSFEAGKKVEGRVKYILQGLHRLCEPFGTSVPWTQRVTVVPAGQTYKLIFPTRDQWGILFKKRKKSRLFRCKHNLVSISVHCFSFLWKLFKLNLLWFSYVTS